MVDGSLRDRGGFFRLGCALVGSEAVLGYRSQISVLILSRASGRPQDSFFEASSVIFARGCFVAGSVFLSSLVQGVPLPFTRFCTFTCDCYMTAFNDSFHPGLFSFSTLVFQHYLQSVYVSLSYISLFHLSRLMIFSRWIVFNREWLLIISGN